MISQSVRNYKALPGQESTMAKSEDQKSAKTAKPPRPAAAPAQFDRAAEEAKLVKKYPKQTIVKGSLRDAGEVTEFGRKRTIEIVCQGDKKTKRRIATSDLHQVMYSEEHIKKLRLERRKSLRATNKKEKVAKAPRANTKKPITKTATKAPKTATKAPGTRAPRGKTTTAASPEDAGVQVATGATND